MKKIALITLILINSFSLKANQQPQSSWNKALAAITCATTLATGAIAGFAWWQWNQERSYANASRNCSDYVLSEREKVLHKICNHHLNEQLDQLKSLRSNPMVTEEQAEEGVTLNDLIDHSTKQDKNGMRVKCSDMFPTVDGVCGLCQEASKKPNQKRTECPSFKTQYNAYKTQIAHQRKTITKNKKIIQAHETSYFYGKNVPWLLIGTSATATTLAVWAWNYKAQK